MALTNPNKSTWNPDDTGGQLVEVDASAVVDNIFIYSTNAFASGKARRVVDGPYRASWAGVLPTASAINNTSRLNAILAHPDIEKVVFDLPEGGDIELSGAINGQGKKITISSSKLIGTYTIDDAVFDADPIDFILGGTPTITNSKSVTGKWYPNWFGAVGDGVTDDYLAINNAVITASANSQKIVNLLPANYLIESNLTISSGVILQFEVGSMLSGIATLSGSGKFDSKPYKIFGDDLIVSTIYPLEGEITPQHFGAVGNNSTNDSPAFQRMWDYIATISATALFVKILPYNYYTPDTIFLPKTSLTYNRFISVRGYGSRLRTDTNNPIFSRHPLSMAESTTCIEAYKCVLEGIFFEGNSTAVADQESQIGLDIGSTYTWEIRNCFFYRLYKGIEAQFWLNGKIINCHFTQNRYCDIMGRYGDWTGANVFNTAFNSNQIEACRFFSFGTAFTTVYLLGADQTLVKECISEGLNPLYNFYFDYAGSTVVNTNTYENIWFESSGGVNTQNTNFYLRAAGEIYLKNIQRELPNRLFEVAVNSSPGVTLIVDGVPYFSNLPTSGLTAFSRNGSVNADWKFIFKNIYTGVVGGLLPPEIASNWDGGTLPISLSIDTYTGVGGGVTLGQRKSNLTEVISAQSVVIKNTLRAGVNFRGLAINMPQSSNSLPSVSSHLLGITDLTPTVPSASLIGSQRHVFFFGQNTSANAGTQLGTCYATNNSDEGRTSIFTHLVARGNLASPTSVTNGVTLGVYRTQSFDGTNVITTGLIKWMVDGTPSTGIIPTSWEVKVMDSTGAMLVPLKVRASGQLELAVSPTTGALADSILVRASSGELRQIASTSLIATGSQYQLSYYSANGNALSPLTAITGSRALVSNANGLPEASTTTSTELGYVSGVTSSIQTQLNGKQAVSTNVVSGAASLALGVGVAYYTFTGTTSTWTLAAVSGNTLSRVTLINSGSGIITLNSNAGGNDIWESGTPTNSISINPGEIYILYNNSLSWVVIP